MKKNIINIWLLALLSVPTLSVHAATVHPFVDVLYWKASEASTAWATTLEPLADPSHVIQSYINSGNNLGFKAGLTYDTDNQFWNTTLYWTHYGSNTSKTIPLNSQVVTSLFFSGSYFISEDVFFGATGKWQMQMNIFDINASHPFKPTPALTLTPRVGIKGGTIDQDINITWNAILYNSNEKVTNNFTGIGPSFGLDSTLNIYKGVNLVGNIATAIMYGRWNGTDTYYRPPYVLGLIPEQTITTSMTNSYLGTMMMDYYLGLEWVHEGQSRVTLRLGYEMQYWANQLRFITLEQFPISGDLTLQGATCGITIDL